MNEDFTQYAQFLMLNIHDALCRYDELETLKDNLYWNTFRHREYLPDMCKDCDKTDICDGGCREAAHVYYGKINDNDPIFETE